MADASRNGGQSNAPQPGMPALKAHIMNNKVHVALWAIRLLTMLCTVGYILPVFNNAVSAYYKALLGNGAISALRLHQRISPESISLSREFFARLFLEDSAHYLFYSLIFINVTPNLLILLPVFLFAMLHCASYTLTLLDTLGQNSMWVLRIVISLVEFQSRNILRLISFAEIALFPVVVLLAFFGYSGLLVPFMYYYFITWRYASRRNPHTRNTFHELRVMTESLAAKPSMPSFARSALLTGVQLTCKLAPPTEAPQPS